MKKEKLGHFTKGQLKPQTVFGLVWSLASHAALKTKADTHAQQDDNSCTRLKAFQHVTLNDMFDQGTLLLLPFWTNQTEEKGSDMLTEQSNTLGMICSKELWNADMSIKVLQ